MAVKTAVRPEVALEQRIHRQPFGRTVGHTEILGGRLTAVIGNVGETRAVREWIDGARVPAEQRQQILGFAPLVATRIARAYGRESAKSWFQGLNAHLEDHVPALMLRDLPNDALDVASSVEKRILDAARNFTER